MQESLQKFIDAGKEYNRHMAVTAELMGQRAANGFPGPMGAFAKAPFDTLGDSLRGTTSIMKDMYRYPDKLLKALDVVADLTISNVLNSPAIARMTMVSYPLHKGADGWMSQKQFDTFYWPSLKKCMDAFIEEGLIQSLFAEGSFETRLEAVNVFPKGTTHWYFDQTDMKLAKEVLGKNYSIQGNFYTGQYSCVDGSYFGSGNGESILPQTFRRLRTGWRLYNVHGLYAGQSETGKHQGDI